MVWGAIAGAVIANTASNLYDDYRQRKADKRQYTYNSWLQGQNQSFQKYMASHAHQLEMQDLKEAGLNPALTAHGSSAASIAGSSSPQGTSAGKNGGNMTQSVNQIVDNINSLRQTNAGIDKTNAEIQNINANTLATIEMLPLSKKEKKALIKFTNERARGITNSSSYSGNFGNKLIGGGGSYSNTTVR